MDPDQTRALDPDPTRALDPDPTRAVDAVDAGDTDRPRSRWWILGWLAALGASFAGMVAVVYIVTVRTTDGRVLDGAALRGAVLTRTRASEAVEGVLDSVSAVSLLAVCALVAFIALVRRRRGLALAAVALLVGANATSQLLKRMVLSRPDLGLDESTPATLNSMPSGHATVAMSVAVALVLVLPAAVRPLTAVLGLGYASVTAMATLSAGWHRPSDAAAAFLVVGAWAALVGLLVVALDDPAKRADPRPDAHDGTSRRLALAAAYLLAFGVLVVVVSVAGHLDPAGTSGQLLAYFASAGIVAGIGATVMAAFLVVMHRIAPGRRPEER